MSRIWAGIDSGKGHHHGPALDVDGETLLSRRVANDELELLKLISDVLDLADSREVTWAIDMTGGEPALLLALLINHGQVVLYMPGRLVNRASDGYRGEGKKHFQAVLALARRRVNVLWALIRDRRCYQVTPFSWTPAGSSCERWCTRPRS
ncbi:IS110 family transposase [Streptomyces sp. NBC_01217]|uniref:IS110 family transposase n=1 Tax=Streptomyces sp. NBC_01217 TaxID=2903779 RepID=UPI003FA3CFBF